MRAEKKALQLRTGTGNTGRHYSSRHFPPDRMGERKRGIGKVFDERFRICR